VKILTIQSHTILSYILYSPLRENPSQPHNHIPSRFKATSVSYTSIYKIQGECLCTFAYKFSYYSSDSFTTQKFTSTIYYTATMLPNSYRNFLITQLGEVKLARETGISYSFNCWN